MLATKENLKRNNKNGQFGTLVRSKNRKFIDTEIDEFTYLDKNDKRMRFNNSRDPIYYVFDVLENRPISTLAKEFVKDSFSEITNFVSKVVR